MSQPNQTNSTRQFIIALIIVLIGVAIGSWITLKKDTPGQSQRPLQPGTATNAPR